jgi:hypothetical protein
MVIGQSGVNGRNVMYLVEEGIKLGIEHVQSQSHSMVETTVLRQELLTIPKDQNSPRFFVGLV